MQEAFSPSRSIVQLIVLLYTCMGNGKRLPAKAALCNDDSIEERIIIDTAKVTYYYHVGGYLRPTMDKDKIITIIILIGLFGGLVGGPIASIADYYAPPDRRFWLFIIPEFIGFACIVILIIHTKTRGTSTGSS